jgi:hypothetical protein
MLQRGVPNIDHDEEGAGLHPNKAPSEKLRNGVLVSEDLRKKIDHREDVGFEDALDAFTSKGLRDAKNVGVVAGNRSNEEFSSPRSSECSANRSESDNASYACLTDIYFSYLLIPFWPLPFVP